LLNQILAQRDNPLVRWKWHMLTMYFHTSLHVLFGQLPESAVRLSVPASLALPPCSQLAATSVSILLRSLYRVL
jgi:hypothetical protein